MGNKTRAALAALAGAAAVTAGAIAFADASAAAGPSPAPLVQAGLASCVTDGSGYCTVPHHLGLVPEAILVSAVTPAAANSYLLSTVQGSYTPATFRVRAMVSQATPKTAGQIWFNYAAYVPASAQGSPTPTPPPHTSETPTSPPYTSVDPTLPTHTSVDPTPPPHTSLEPTPAPSSR
ncbi:hypothetical protein [Amycolatopsis sp. lyj-346]|uniref:hypothetical protein n=1 Tax=Amycolatopsis sp. lyj-346 TaxID=2789289 RepID=UPI00397DE5AF